MKSFRQKLIHLVSLFALTAHAQQTNVTVDANAAKPISPDLVGIFFEDLNFAADGGLYAELVQNRSFEYNAAEQPNWGPLTAWKFVEGEGGGGTLTSDSEQPLNPNNPHHAVLAITTDKGFAGIENSGFDGIAVKENQRYRFSVFARTLEGDVGSLEVGLESRNGELLGSVKLPKLSTTWREYTASIAVRDTANDARLVILATQPGKVALDEVSLFPEKTFKGRVNGLRADLAQAIADLHPKFMRFPGGCLAHGDGIANIYRWKDTIGPIEQRKGQPNIWRYHQSVGLGYFEYFQFCEDIGAKPLPVLAAGVSCQNSSHSRGTGQQCIPMEDMPAYVQEVLDLVEYANGPATSKWGSKRAAAGHAAPFGLKYLGIGNEDHITPGFKERFQMIFEAVRKKHPEIIVVGTVGPAPDGEDFDKGWQIANELRVPMVDEHYYKRPQWFWENLHRYDGYDRSKPKVYLGEYAAHDDHRRSTLRAALAEAACLTSLEKNGDVVRLASYAPLLARRGHTQWSPDLIYFNGTDVFPTISYHVQQLFGTNSGDSYLPTSVSEPRDFAASTVRDSKSGDLILKLVNGGNAPKPLHIELKGVSSPPKNAIRTVLTGANADVVNPDGGAPAAKPEVSTIEVGRAFDCEAPANSLTVIRMKSK